MVHPCSFSGASYPENDGIKMAYDNHNLGTLELAILEYFWNHDACEVKTVHGAIGVPRGITHNTVQSTMKRLWEKGLLAREKQGHAYIYSARTSRRELTELMVNQLIVQVADSKIEVALEAFVNLAEQAGDKTLTKLEELIARRRAEEKE